MKKTQKIISVVLALVMLMCTMSLFASAQTENTKFVLLGDSIAFGTGVSNPEVNSYGALISQANGYSYENYSVPGHTTAAMITRLQNEEVVTGVADADIIAVSIGGNNFLLSGLMEMIMEALVKNDYAKINEVVNEIYSEFNRVIDRIKEINPEAELLMQTLYNPRDDVLKEAYQHGVDGLNAQLRKILAERPGEFTIVEVGAAFSNNTDLIQSDGIHPNEQGHYVIAQEYVKVLYEMGLGTASELSTEMPATTPSFWEKLISMIKEFLATLKAMMGI